MAYYNNHLMDGSSLFQFLKKHLYDGDNKKFNETISNLRTSYHDRHNNKFMFTEKDAFKDYVNGTDLISKSKPIKKSKNLLLI